MTAKRADRLDQMMDAFLQCRDTGHHWSPLTAKVTAGTRGQPREIARRFDCNTCGTERHEVFAWPSCEVRSRTYVYPDLYLLADGGKVDGVRVSVRDVRRETFVRSGIKPPKGR